MRTSTIGTALVLCSITVGASAQPTLKALSIPWSNSNALTVGTGVDVDLIDQQRGTCLIQTAKDVSWFDGAGAAQTQSKMELISTYQELTNTLNLAVDYKAKADVDIAVLKGGGSVNLNVKYDTFAKDESRTLALVFKAWSDYGRNGFAKYSLDKPSADLIANGKYAEFRAACGTHTVVAQHNEALVAVVILMTDLTAESKRTMESTFASNFKGAASIDAASLSGSVDMSANWKSFMSMASRLSKVTVEFESKGGAGIPDALKASVSPQNSQLDTIITALQSIGPSFSQNTSAPVQYFLVSNTVFGLKKEVADAAKLDVLNGYYLQLGKVDFALSRVAGYSTTYPGLVSVYQSDPKVANLRTYRSQIVDAIESCVLRNTCDYQAPKTLGVLFAEDIFTDTKVELKCLYTRYDTPDKTVGLNILTNAAAILKGRARLVSHVGLSTAILSRISPASAKMRPMITRWQSLLAMRPRGNDTVELTAQIDNQTFRENVEVTAGGVRLVNEAEMRQALEDTLKSIYTIEVQHENGLSVVNTVGPPYGGNCPLTLAVR